MSQSAAIPRPTLGDLLILGWVRWRVVRAAAAALRRAPLKGVVVAGVWSVLLAVVYLLAARGIAFLDAAAGVGPFLLDRLWYLFLFVVMGMLAISQLACAYSTMVRAPETAWWMTLPISARTLGRAKWCESSFYSGWAVVILVVPVALAYLVVLERSWWLAGWLLLLLLPLLGLVTALASAGLLVWLRWCGSLAVRREVMALGFVAVSAVTFWLLAERQEATGHEAWFVALQELLPRMQFAMQPAWPSSWVARALGAGLHGRWMEGLLYFALLWTSAALAWRLFDHTAARLLWPVLRRRDDGPARAPTAGGRGDITFPWRVRAPFGAALVKDLLLVARDPMQWTQAVVFFGLLGAYFANLHQLAGASVDPAWRLGIATLNLACTLLVFGSLAVRFVFPQMSLESRSLWLWRLAPRGLQRLLMAKFLLYGLLAVAITEGLLWLSASRLGIPIGMRWWLTGVGAVASVTIVGLAVGLGAWWMDPAGQDAARVVSSSAGALTLVLVLGYIGGITLALIVAWGSWTRNLPLLGLVSSSVVLVSAATAIVVLRGGLRRIDRAESILD